MLPVRNTPHEQVGRGRRGVAAGLLLLVAGCALVALTVTFVGKQRPAAPPGARKAVGNTAEQQVVEGSLQCMGFNIGLVPGGSSVVASGIAKGFDPDHKLAGASVTSTAFYIESLNMDIPFTLTLSTLSGNNEADCHPQFSYANSTAGSTDITALATYNCTSIGQSELEATLTLGGACSAMAPVNFFWFKTHGSAFRLGTVAGGADVVNEGQTAGSWQTPSGHFYHAQQSQLVLYAGLPVGASRQPFQTQLITTKSTGDNIASPIMLGFPTTLIANETFPITFEFGCRASGHVDVTIEVEFEPYASSTFTLSYHCLYVQGLTGVLTTLNDASVVVDGETRPAWTSPATIRGPDVGVDTFSFFNGGDTFTLESVQVNTSAFHGHAKCEAVPSGDFYAGGVIKSGATANLTLTYDCPQGEGAWTQITVYLTPQVALSSSFTWQKLSGHRSGFDIYSPQLNATIVQDGVVAPQFVSHGSTSAAAVTVAADVWALTFECRQMPVFPEFVMVNPPAISAIGLRPYSTHGVTPIASGNLITSLTVSDEPSMLDILFWSKDSIQDAVVNVGLSLPYFPGVQFAFNKKMQWQMDLTVNVGGVAVSADGQVDAAWGPAGVDNMVTFAPYQQVLNFFIQSSSTDKIDLGAVQIHSNATHNPACHPYVVATSLTGISAMQDASVEVHFNCSNTAAVTLFTFAIPILTPAPKGTTYTPLLWQLLKVSAPSFPTTPVITGASAESETAQFTFSTDLHRLQLTKVDVRQYSCNSKLFTAMEATAATQPGGGYAITVANLQNKHSYQFSVQVSNDMGASGFSERSACVTPLFSYKLIITLSCVGGGFLLVCCSCYIYSKGCNCYSCCSKVCPCCKCRCRCCRPPVRTVESTYRVPKKKKKKAAKSKHRKRKRKQRRDLEAWATAHEPLIDARDVEAGGSDDDVEPHTVPLTQEMSISSTRDVSEKAEADAAVHE